MRAPLLITVFVAICHAQVSPFNMFPGCPEGCRQVDKIVSCGSVAETANCNMAVNGDVLLQCTNGNSYFLGQFGCSSNVTGSTPLDYFFDKTRICVNLVAEQFSNYDQYFCPVMMVIACWVTTAGYRFISPTLTIFAFIWEFFFALYILIMAQASNAMALYFSLGLSVFVALLCLWRGPVFGRAIVGVSMGTLVSVTALVIAGQSIGYVSIFVVIGLDVIGVAFAYIYKRSTIIALFAISTFVLVFVCIAVWSGNDAAAVRTDGMTALLLIGPSAAVALVCVAVNSYWCKKREQQRKINQRFEQHLRSNRNEMLDVSNMRPGEGRQSPTSRTGSPSGRGRGARRGAGPTPVSQEYGAMYNDMRV